MFHMVSRKAAKEDAKAQRIIDLFASLRPPLALRETFSKDRNPS